MNPNRRRLLMSIINGITILSMTITMALPVANFATMVNAQDATPEAVATTETPTEAPAPTDGPAAPTEAATTPPTDEPTAVVTDEPTSVVTEEPTSDATITEPPATEPTSVVTEEPKVLWFGLCGRNR